MGTSISLFEIDLHSDTVSAIKVFCFKEPYLEDLNVGNKSVVDFFNITLPKGGATNLKVGGQCIGRWGVNTVKTQQFEKGGGA